MNPEDFSIYRKDLRYAVPTMLTVRGYHGFAARAADLMDSLRKIQAAKPDQPILTKTLLSTADSLVTVESQDPGVASARSWLTEFPLLSVALLKRIHCYPNLRLRILIDWTRCALVDIRIAEQRKTHVSLSDIR